MINSYFKEDIVKHLASIIDYGIISRYSFRGIEELIIKSSFVDELEKNYFDSNRSIDQNIELTYGVKLVKDYSLSFQGLFIAESYINLFFHFRKSFEYLFLYWPLEDFYNRYNIYHEMDFSNLRQDFAIRVSRVSLLKKLGDKYGIKYTEMAKLTSISINTINKFAKADRYLYSTSYENIYRLAILFKIKENTFIKELPVYIDTSIYLFDDSNRDLKNYLGFYFVNYYDTRISNKVFVYYKEENAFIAPDGEFNIKVIAIEAKDLSIETINQISNEYTYVVVILTGIYFNDIDFDYLKDAISFDIAVITRHNIHFIKKNAKKEITSTINDSLFIEANEKANIIKGHYERL